MFSLYLSCRIDAGNQSLCRCFLITGSAVKLTRTIQTFHLQKLQRWTKVQRVDTVIFNRIGVAHDADILKADNRAIDLHLYIFRQGGRKTLQIHLLGIQSHRFHKGLVAWFFCKAHYLVLDTWTIARTDALDHSSVQRRTMDVVADNLVCLFVGISNVADHLIF